MDNSITVYAQRQGEATVLTIRHPAGAIPDEQSAERLLQTLRQAVQEMRCPE